MPINTFNDIPRRPLPQREGIGGFNDLRDVAALQVGIGIRAFKTDESGMWLGAHKFADAPFSVDMAGALAAKSATFKDEDDTTVIDAKGLVSTASFINGSVHNTAVRSITSTSFVDVANTSITTASFPRTTNVLIFMNVIMKLYLPDTDEIQWGQVVLNIDGTDKTLTSFDYTLTDSRLYTPGEFSFDSRTISHTGLSIESLASGIHTFKIRSKVGGQTLKILSTSVVYLVLGK